MRTFGIESEKRANERVRRPQMRQWVEDESTATSSENHRRRTIVGDRTKQQNQQKSTQNPLERPPMPR